MTDLACRPAHAADMPAVLALRHEVFVREQGVAPQVERDAHDAVALHLIAERSGALLGCCRLVAEDGHVRLGRMAVAAAERGRGTGARLLAYAEEVARHDGARAVILHAQVAARPFYARAGYTERGAEFVEAGIVHVEMHKALTPAPAPPR